METLKQQVITDPRYRSALESCLERPHLLVALTGHCNFSCAYCSTAKAPRQRVFMDVALARRLVEQAIDLGWPLFFGQTYEPFLHPRIGEVIEAVTRRGRRFAAATNGLAIRPALYDAPMDLTVSYSADAADYALRGSRLAYAAYRDRLLRFFRHRLAARVPGVIAVQIADYSIFHGALTYDKTIADIDGILAKARDLAAALDLPQPEDTPAVRAAIAARQGLPLFADGPCHLVVLPTKIMPNAYDAFVDLPEPEEPAGYCDSCYTMLSVQADGGAAFCCCDPVGRAQAGRLTAGTDLREFWRGPAMTRVRRQFEAMRPCHGFCTQCLAPVSEHIKPLLTVERPDVVAAILRDLGVTEDQPWFQFPGR